MLYNEDNKKFIFVHIPKCAGTTIERFFGKDYDGYNTKTDYTKYIELKHEIAHSKHYRLSDYEKIIGDELNDYFKFTFIRNPYDLVVSKFIYIKTKNKTQMIINGEDITEQMTFDQYVDFIHRNKDRERIPKSVVVSNYDEWIITDNYKLDFIGKVENFNNDFKIICDKIGVKYKKLNKMNTTIRTEYRDYYNQDTKNKITELFKDDLEKYNYKF